MPLSPLRPWSLVPWNEVEPDDVTVSPAVAAAWLDALFYDPHRRAELFEALEALTGARARTSFGREGNDLARDLGPVLHRAIASGELVVVTQEGKEAWRRMKMEQPVSDALPPPVMPAAAPAKTWIEFLVEDMAGQPLAGRKYRATLTDGTTKKGETDSKGLVRFDPLDPGLCEFVLEGLDGDAWETAEGSEWIEFLVTDAENKPLAGVRYEAKLTNGQTKSGETGRNGLLRFEGLAAGICEFRLPDFDADQVLDASEATDWIELQVNGTDDAPKAGVEWVARFADGSTKTGTTDATGLVRVERLRSGKVDVSFPGAEAELMGSVVKGAAKKAATGTLEFELLDVDGKPVRDVRFVAEWSDGTTREGVTDDQGIGRIENVEEGEYSVSFPDHDASAWEAA